MNQLIVAIMTLILTFSLREKEPAAEGTLGRARLCRAEYATTPTDGSTESRPTNDADRAEFPIPEGEG